MALDGNALGDLIRAKIDALIVADRRAIFRAIGNAIVEHMASGGIAAAGTPTTEMRQWMSTVASVYGVPAPFAAVAIVKPTAPSYSTATVRCSGTPGASIPQGSLVSDGGAERFASTAPAVIGGGGFVDVPFQAQSSGAIAAGANTLTVIVTPAPGWASATNPSAASAGSNPVGLNGNTLGDLIKANIDATVPPTDRTALFRAIGNAVVSHISSAGIAAAPAMVTWQAAVEAAATPSGSITPAAATFNSVAIVK